MAEQAAITVPASPPSPRCGSYPEGRDPVEEIRQLGYRRVRVARAVFDMAETFYTIIPLVNIGSLVEPHPKLRIDMEKVQRDYQLLYLESVNYGLTLHQYFVRNGGRSGLLHPEDRQEIQTAFRLFKLAMSRLSNQLRHVGALCDGLFAHRNDHHLWQMSKFYQSTYREPNKRRRCH